MHIHAQQACFILALIKFLRPYIFLISPFFLTLYDFAPHQHFFISFHCLYFTLLHINTLLIDCIFVLSALQTFYRPNKPFGGQQLSLFPSENVSSLSNSSFLIFYTIHQPFFFSFKQELQFIHNFCSQQFID